MSQRRTTVPPTHESSRVVASRTVRADCKDKTEKQSAKRRTVLDNRFHRTARRAADAAIGRVSTYENSAAVRVKRKLCGR